MDRAIPAGFFPRGSTGPRSSYTDLMEMLGCLRTMQEKSLQNVRRSLIDALVLFLFLLVSGFLLFEVASLESLAYVGGCIIILPSSNHKHSNHLRGIRTKPGRFWSTV